MRMPGWEGSSSSFVPSSTSSSSSSQEEITDTMVCLARGLSKDLINKMEIGWFVPPVVRGEQERQVVRWAGGQVVRWGSGQVVRGRDGQVIRWGGGQVARLCGG